MIKVTGTTPDPGPGPGIGPSPNKPVLNIPGPGSTPRTAHHYQKTKNSFYRELFQFHESRGMTVKENLKINGKEIDLYLLYQVVTSRGGWEKVNMKDEWDDLLKYFRLPKATNSSVVIKRIYLKNLELYEKIHFLGEDVDGKNDEDDDYDDFKLRRRYNPAKITCFTPTPTVAALTQPVHITGEIREQLGLAKEISSTEYDRLLLSLQSPLPNEQDMAISVCTLLSNETRHALKFNKCPAVMELLLAHAGIFNHCNTRILMEETYESARGLNFHDFWRTTISNSDVRELLCECSLERYQNGVWINPPGGIEDESYDEDLPEMSEEKADYDMSTIEESEPVESETTLLRDQSNSNSMSEEESSSSSPTRLLKSQPVPLDVVDGMPPLSESKSSPNHHVQEDESLLVGDLEKPTGAEEEGVSEIVGDSFGTTSILQEEHDSEEIELLRVSAPAGLSLSAEDESDDDFGEEIQPPGEEGEVLWDLLDKDVTASNVDCEPCCPRCPCLRQPTIFETEMTVEEMDILEVEKNAETTEKIGQRIYQVANIIRNLSFDKVNAEIMGHNSCILRFILVTAHCSYGSLSQLSFDTLGNIARYMNLEAPLENPYFGMIISLVIDGVFSVDRFRLLRSLETLREWCREESNERVVSRVMDPKFFSRLCELLTLTDIMVLVYTLECILSITSMGLEEVCSALVHVSGSVDTLVSLVTVEAQSYGPKGCIQMRVVETLVGHPALQPSAQGPSGAESDTTSQTQTTYQSSSIPIPQQQQLQPVLRPIPTQPRLGASTPPALVPSNTMQQHSLNIKIERQSSSPIQSSPVPTSASCSPKTFHNMPTAESHSQSPQPTSSTDTRLLPRLGWNNTPVASPQQFRTPQTVSTVAQNGINSTHSTVGQEVVPGKVVPSQVTPRYETHVFYNSVRVLTPMGVPMTEEAWGVAWVKSAFEQVQGCSIEQEKMYRMYSTARKDPNVVLPMEEFINCVKCCYGAGIGPVIKNFSGTPLSFLEGLRPKMTLANMGGGAMGQPTIVKLSTVENPQVLNSRTEVCTDQNSQTNEIEQHIPPREIKTTSPILKATLSRPPKTPKNSPSKKQKGTKGKRGRSGRDESQTGVMNPTSSVIRSLLASKVAQRQQKKLQLTEPNKKFRGKNCKDKKKGNGKEEVKVNGVEAIMKVESEISSTSASSSLHSTGSVDSTNPPPLISFQGILRNGLNSETGTKGMDVKEEIQQGTKFKGMLVDLLERKVVPRENMNGLIGNREIRISDRGLELVDAIEADSDSRSGTPPLALPLTTNHIPTSTAAPVFNPSSFSSGGTSMKSETNSSNQQMTFYSASVSDHPITSEGVMKNCKSEDRPDENCFGSSEHEMVLMSGGGGGEGAENSANEEEESDTVEISMDDADLLEKFNEISDLIVVPPEQLGLKRSRSASEESCVVEEPPMKKKLIESSDQVNTFENSPPEEIPPPLTEPVESAMLIPKTADVPEDRLKVVPILDPQTTTPSTSVVTTSNGIQGKSLVQVPVPTRLSLNPATHQYAFARPLIFSAGQQILLQTPHNSTSLHGAKVLISKPANSSGDQRQQAYFILQPQPATSSSSSTPTTLKISTTCGIPISTTSVPALSASSNNNLVNTTNSIKVQPSGRVEMSFQPGSKTTFSNVLATNPLGPQQAIPKTSDQLDLEIPYLCEWIGCGQRFLKPEQVMMHALQIHAPESLTEAVRCEWHTSGCDGLIRKRFSLMTHLQDRHCSRSALEVSLYRRKNKIESPPPPPQAPVNHLGYAPNAAFHAIKRHAIQFTNPKELQDDTEGPVTKSIRLTSALILKNLCNYSTIGRRSLKRHESHLASVAMSNVESARTIAQLLYDMNELGN